MPTNLICFTQVSLKQRTCCTLGNFGRTSCKSIRESLHFLEKWDLNIFFCFVCSKTFKHMFILWGLYPSIQQNTPWWHSIIQQQKSMRQISWHIISWIPKKPEVLWFFETNTCLERRSHWKQSKTKWWLWWRSRTPFNKIFDQMMLKCLDNKLIVVRECVLSSSQGSGPLLNPLPQKATLVTIVGYTCFFKIPLKYTNLNQKSH